MKALDLKTLVEKTHSLFRGKTDRPPKLRVDEVVVYGKNSKFNSWSVEIPKSMGV